MLTLIELNLKSYSNTFIINQSNLYAILVSLLGGLTYSEVRAFLKKRPTVTTMYMSITTASKKTIRLTENHLIYTRKSCADKFIPM